MRIKYFINILYIVLKMPFRRKKMFRRKRVVRKRRVKKGILTRNVTTILRATGAFTTDVGGVAKPQLLDDPTGFLDWGNFGTLYDLYRVNSIKINYYPNLPFDSSITTGYKPVYFVFDPDNVSSPLGAITDALEFANLRVFNLYRPWSIMAKVPTVTSISASATNIKKGGWIDISQAKATCGIFGYASGLDTSETYGDLVLKINISFKGRR